MQDLEITFAPNLNAVQCTMPFGFFYGSELEKVNGGPPL